MDPYFRLSHIESHPVDLTDQIFVADTHIKASHIFSPVSVPDDAVYDEGIQSATHGVGQPCVPEVMDTGAGLKAQRVQRLPPGELERIFVRCSSLGCQEQAAGERSNPACLEEVRNQELVDRDPFGSPLFGLTRVQSNDAGLQVDVFPCNG